MKEINIGLSAVEYDQNKIWESFRIYPGVKGIGTNNYRMIVLFIEDSVNVWILKFMIDTQKRNFRRRR